MAIILISVLIFISIKKNSDIDIQLNQIDKYIDEEEYSKASNSILKLKDNLNDRYSSYRVIKRAIDLGEKTDNYFEFLEISKQSVELYSGNEDLQAYYVKALLKNKEFDLAYEVALDQLVSNEFKPLLAEAILHYENQNNSGLTITQYIKGKQDPAFFEYLANLLDNRELLINSALLWAKNGEIEKAYNLINTFEDEVYKELIALITYDSGRQSESLVRLLDLPINDSIKYDNLLLIADLFYIKENWARSRYYYEQAMEINIYKSASYINLSSIYLELDNTKSAISILEQGIKTIRERIDTINKNVDQSDEDLDISQTSDELKLSQRVTEKNREEISSLRDSYKELILLIHYLYKQIGSDNSIRVIEEYRRDFPDDVKVELLEMRENNSRSNPQFFIPRLWKLLNTDIDNREVSEFLIWYLLGLENYKDINLVLERSENRFPDNSNWTKYYRGILSGLNGDYKTALKYFEDDSLNVDDWEVLYNRGIIELALQNFPEALTLFNKSIISINQQIHVNNRDIYISKIQTKIAQVLINLNDTEEAIRVLNNAFELDPNNYTSDLLKSIHINLMEDQ